MTMPRPAAEATRPDRAAGLDGSPDTESSDLPADRLLRAKFAYTARHAWAEVAAAEGHGYRLVRGEGVRPRAGDFVLARAAEIGHHKRIESHDSYRRHLFVGDEIVVAYGGRYAPDQFLAELPTSLGPTSLVAAGGIAADVQQQHTRAASATRIEPIGLLASERGILNLADAAPGQPQTWQAARARIDAARANGLRAVTVVLGSSMNSGKSTSLACLVNGLAASGLTVAAGKATGTGAGNDANLFRDAGARHVLDFTDFGYPSTYRLSPGAVKDLVFSVIAELAATGADAVVVEIADGLFQGETAALVADPDLGDAVDSVVFACGEALGAAAGTEALLRAGLPLAAVTGVLTSSPLIADEARRVSSVPVVVTGELGMPEVARRVVGV